MAQPQPEDIVEYLRWLDTSGKGRTVVHGVQCTAVGTWIFYFVVPHRRRGMSEEHTIP